MIKYKTINEYAEFSVPMTHILKLNRGIKHDTACEVIQVTPKEYEKLVGIDKRRLSRPLWWEDINKVKNMDYVTIKVVKTLDGNFSINRVEETL